MYWSSIAYFFAVTVSTGTFIDLFVKNWQADWLEKLVMRFGVGLAAFSVEGVILNLLHIPLDYRIFLGTGLLILIAALTKNKPFSSSESRKIFSRLPLCWKNKTFWYALFMLLLFAVTAKMYIGGTFKYTYFEDTDPWGYTAVAHYIGETKTFSAPYYSVQYNEPYTQGYQIVMGVLSQTNDSIYWTMKFFTALIISFGVLFMYFFARRLSEDEEIAVLAGFFLFAVPAWVSHFVFSLHYNMTIFVVLLYVLAQLMAGYRRQIAAFSSSEPPGGTVEPQESKLSNGLAGWTFIGTIVYASMLVNHFTTSVHATIFCFIFIVTRILAEKKIDWKTIMVFLGGFLVSLLFYIPAWGRHWELTEAKQPPGGIGGVWELSSLMHFVVTPFGWLTMAMVLALMVLIYRSRRHWQQRLEGWLAGGQRGMLLWLGGLAVVLLVLFLPVKICQILGTADRFFSLRDFFSGTAQNMINNPVGLGPILMSAVIASFLLACVKIRRLFRPDNAWIAVCFAWIIAAFLLVLGKYLSITVVPFRVWTFLGLFASLFAAWGLVTLIRGLCKNYWVLLGAMLLLAVIAIPTSFITKWQINTTPWRDATIGTPQSRALFTWMRNGGIPKNSVVAHLCGNSEFLSSYDMNPPLWNKTFHPPRGVKEPYFVAHPLDITPEAYGVLKKAQVQYVTIGLSCLWQTHLPSEKRAAFERLLQKKMYGDLTDRRLELVKSTDYELLFKLK